MRCPNLYELPSPPEGKNGWPWTEESLKLSERRESDEEWPKVSIVIPSYNQGQYIEETIRSILLQGYPNLECIVVDGGSTDNTLQILKKYEAWFSSCLSESDNGQSNAINKGIKLSNGKWFAWMNSDDIYYKNAFHKLSEDFSTNIDFLYGKTAFIDENSVESGIQNPPFLNLDKLLLSFYSNQYIIPSQSVFVKMELIDAVGGLDENLCYSMDIDWYIRFRLKNVVYKQYNNVNSGYRIHKDAKSQAQDLFFQEAYDIYWKYREYLEPNVAVRLDKIYNHCLILRKITKDFYRHREKADIHTVLSHLFHSPIISFNDTRFLGMAKRILARSFFKAFYSLSKEP